ncbi:energy-coupling factor transporter ATPase [Desulfotomaculum sp. 1211_IL3151]|uniref:energy-coupling factor transporter ATPase n=1 Tax=Desulfotomaculum sp. 1211_IL3151 TaxID=3084055 RepID=UPI002FD89627
MSPIIEIKGLNVVYAPKSPMERQALGDLNFSVAEGEFRAIIGSQGSGKSTLLQVMAGLIAGKGTVKIAGLDLSIKKNRTQLWRQVGVVFQYPEKQLFEDTVWHDVAYGPQNLGLGQTEVNRRVKRALDRVKLEKEYFQVSPFKLSGGQQRRVAIAGILAMEPKILLLDEPTAGLDPRGRQQLMNMFSTLCSKEKVTIVLVTHDMEEVACRADRVTVLQQGKVAMEGTPQEVFNNKEKLEALGLGVPFASELAASLKGKGVSVKEMTTLHEAEREVGRLLKARGHFSS